MRTGAKIATLAGSHDARVMCYTITEGNQVKTLTTMIAFASSRGASPGFTPFCPGDSSANEPLVVEIFSDFQICAAQSEKPGPKLSSPRFPILRRVRAPSRKPPFSLRWTAAPSVLRSPSQQQRWNNGVRARSRRKTLRATFAELLLH